MTQVLLVAAAALLDSDGHVLLAQRPKDKSMAGLWEFPGGKIEPDETPEQALIRELQEELKILVTPASIQPLTFASHTYEKFHLLMPLFLIKKWDGTPEPAEGQSLEWVAPQDLHRYPAPAADIPLFSFLRRHLETGDARLETTSDSPIA